MLSIFTIKALKKTFIIFLKIRALKASKFIKALQKANIQITFLKNN